MRQWRVGTITMGMLLILFGILLLANTVWNIPLEEILVYGWPVVLILIGIEVLLFSFFKKDAPLKFDFFSIFILIVVVSFTFVVYSVQATGIFPAIRDALNSRSYTVEINRSLAIPETVEEILIESTNGHFYLNGGESNNTEITGSIRINAENQEEAEQLVQELLITKIIGNRAIIRVENPDFNHWFKNNMLETDLNIIIPQNKKIMTNLTNGDTHLRHYQGQGNLENINGEILLEEDQGNFDIKTVNGDLSINNLKGNLKASTTNGKLKVKEISGDLDLDTTNGEIEALTKKITGNWDLNTFNGEISVELPGDGNMKVIADSNVGEVTGNISWTNQEDQKLGSHKEAVFGEGEYVIHLESQHGEIEVNLK